MNHALAWFFTCEYLRVMLDVSGYIALLLHRFDCVVIPGMGGFVANYSPAVLDRTRGVIYPPSKGIIFNKNLVKNDGLLVSEIAGQLEVPYHDALGRLTGFVEQCRYTLQTGGRVEINGLGYLYFDAEKNIQYLAHQTVNFLNDSFGLAPVMAVPVAKKLAVVKPAGIVEKVEKPVVQLRPEPKPAEAEKAKPAAETSGARIVAIEEAVKTTVRKNKRKYYWAAAVLLPVLFYTYWIPFQTPYMVTGKFSAKYFNPFAKYDPALYQLRQDAATAETTVNLPADEWETLYGDVPMKQPRNNSFETGNAPVNETTYVAKPVEQGGKHFHIIGGCFMSYENALTQLNELKQAGTSAFLFGQASGFHRVALGSYASRAEALEQLRQARAAGQPNAWLLEE